MKTAPKNSDDSDDITPDLLYFPSRVGEPRTEILCFGGSGPAQPPSFRRLYFYVHRDNVICAESVQGLCRGIGATSGTMRHTLGMFVFAVLALSWGQWVGVYFVTSGVIALLLVSMQRAMSNVR